MSESITAPQKEQKLAHLLARFESFYAPIPECGCWLWLGVETDRGYGQLCVRGKMVYAHRLSYELFREPIPRGLFVLHKCDTRSCVNPDHLFLGTAKSNQCDMARKDRGRKSRLGRPRGVKPARHQFQAALPGPVGYIGLFPTQAEAAEAVARHRKELYG